MNSFAWRLGRLGLAEGNKVPLGRWRKLFWRFYWLSEERQSKYLPPSGPHPDWPMKEISHDDIDTHVRIGSVSDDSIWDEVTDPERDPHKTTSKIQINPKK